MNGKRLNFRRLLFNGFLDDRASLMLLLWQCSLFLFYWSGKAKPSLASERKTQLTKKKINQ